MSISSKNVLAFWLMVFIAYPSFSQLVINEAAFTPTRDLNGDGVFNPIEDEYVEIYNDSNSPINLFGYNIYLVYTDIIFQTSNSILIHSFPFQTLPADSFVTVFGGGQSNGFDVPGIVATASVNPYNFPSQLNFADDSIAPITRSVQCYGRQLVFQWSRHLFIIQLLCCLSRFF